MLSARTYTYTYCMIHTRTHTPVTSSKGKACGQAVSHAVPELSTVKSPKLYVSVEINDILRVHAGAKVALDGIIQSENNVGLDESMLTGA
eukprot:2286987-Amphidinium_carterae.1